MTTKSVGFLSPDGEVISAFHPAVVKMSGFIEQRLASRELKLLGNVNDAATQAEMDKYVADSEGDTDLAIASFLAAFDENAEPPAPPAPAPESEGEGDAEGEDE